MRLLLSMLFILHTYTAFSQSSRFHEQIVEDLDASRYSIALNKLNNHLNKNPNDYPSYKLRGRANDGLSQEEKALTDYNIYLEYYPEDYEAFFERAVLQYQIKMYQQAVESFTYLIDHHQSSEITNQIYFQHTKNSNSSTAIFTVQTGTIALYYYYLGLSYYHMEQTTLAITSFDSALALSPDNPDFQLARALAKESAGNYDQAIEDYKAVLQQTPNHGLAKYNLGNLLNRLGQKEEGAQYIEESIHEQPDLAYPYAEKAFQYMQNERYQIALKEFNKAIEIDSENADYLLNRGKVKIKLEDIDEAADDFRKALQLEPSNANAYFNLAIIEHKKGQHQKAIELLNVALFYDPEYAMAYYNRAIAYYSLKNFTEACADIKNAAQLNMQIPEKLMFRICR